MASHCGLDKALPCRHLQKHFPYPHPALTSALPTQYHSQPGNQILPSIHSGMSLGDWPATAPASLQLSANAASFGSYCARSLQQPVWSCFLLPPPQNHQDPAQPVSHPWTGNRSSQHIAHGARRTDRSDFFLHAEYSPRFCLRMPIPLHRSLRSVLGHYRPAQSRALLSVRTAELASPLWTFNRSILRLVRAAPDCLHPQGGEDATYMKIFLIFLFLLLPSPTHFLLLLPPSCYKAAR